MFQTFILSPESVSIQLGDNPNYWNIVLMDNSRFSQKAELLQVQKLQIEGTFDTAALDKDTTFSVFCILKHTDAVIGLETPTEVSLSQAGQVIWKSQVHLNPGSSDLINQEGEQWLALKVGSFLKRSDDVEKIIVKVLNDDDAWKSGLVFAGVEIRAVKK